MNIALIITAAGSSTRFGAQKKEYLQLPPGTNTVLSQSAETFLRTKLFSSLIITIPNGDEAKASKALQTSQFVNKLLFQESDGITFAFATGGKTRQESVYNGLKKLLELSGKAPDLVLIHDGARPWVTEKIIRNVIEKTDIAGAAVPAIPAVDTQKEVDEHGKITQHLKRKYVYAVQTPQAFEFERLLQAHEKARCDGLEYTDDTEIWGAYCGDVYISEGDIQNKKITFQSDL